MNELKGKESYQALCEDINGFVKSKTENYDTADILGKTIHDPIWGSNTYSRWEMQLIDSPLIQRLRGISQVGLAVLTYPAARHSRFEHTLGVTAATKRLVARININCANDTSNDKDTFNIDKEVEHKLVLAAILHDVGHCFFSHLSESIYGELEGLVDLKDDIKDIYGIKPKSHEILSLLIVISTAFRDFFSRSIGYPNKVEVEKLLEDVGKIIIGADIREGNTFYSYQTAIINGTFDVDKLDYIQRDSYTAGLALDFDIERLYTKIKVHKLEHSKPDKEEKVTEYRLVIQANGVTAVEELTFCKIMLFSYIYYHQKVLITEAMIKDYVQALIRLHEFQSPIDFLKYSESELFNLSFKQNDDQPFQEYGNINLQQLADNIKNRVLPKRCLEISQSISPLLQSDFAESNIDKCKQLLEHIRSNPNYTAEVLDKEINKMISSYTGTQGRQSITEFMSRYESRTYDQILKIRHDIFKELMKLNNDASNDTVDFGVFDIYLVIPSVVSYGTPEEKNILGRDGTLMSINDFVKLEQWASSFNAYKWRGYVYITQKIPKGKVLEACNNVIFDGKIEIAKLKSLLKK